MLKNTFKRNEGITLIALVVTIIVLLVLAGISIAMLTGQNGILNRASEAKEKTALAQEEENEKLQGYEEIINQYSGNLPTKEETKPYFPSDAFYYKEGNLNTGLVIEETATGSQYVWVEVPKTTEVYPTAGVDITSFTDDAYTKIETDLHTYTNEYRNETSYSDVYYTDSTTGWFADADKYNELKKNMLKSVYQNGGFWVGRYEAGIEANRTAEGTATTIPLSRKNLYPYNHVTRTQAKVLAEQVESGSCTSSLMFGVQWDLVLKYIESKNTTIKTKLISNSTTIGNYNNNLWNIKNTNAKYSANYGKSFEACPYPKTASADVLLTTGADASFSLMNIYDIAGNVWEWTLENTSDVSRPCAARGGHYSYNGSDYPASIRDGGNMSGSNSGVGFRISLY